jgi:hypothetical protein
MLTCVICYLTKRKSSVHIACNDCWHRLPQPLKNDILYHYKHNRGSDAHRMAVRAAYAWFLGMADE